MTPAYATTEVSVSRSQEGLRDLLRRHGASSFQFGESFIEGQQVAALEFVHQDQMVRMLVPHKQPDERAIRLKIQRAQTRTPQQIRAEFEEQEARRIWRVMFHSLKARLVAVEEEVETFEQAFLSHLVDPATGRTLWETFAPAVEDGRLRVGGAGLFGNGLPELAPPADDAEIIDLHEVAE